MGQAAVVEGELRPAVVEVNGFCKRYRKQQAVKGVNLTINSGEIYGLIGPDGAGKSSIMKALAGVLRYEEGRVSLFGVDLASEKAAESIKDRIGFMPQGLGLNLYPELSIEENIDFFARLRQVPGRLLTERKERLLDVTRLTRFRDRPMKQLSGGMKQKLGLVCTLIHEPRFIILDEPTTGVDPVSRRDFWAILAELLRDQGITALISTAYMDEASRFHRLSLIYGGRVLAEGEPEAIQAIVPGHEVVIQAEPEMEALNRLRSGFSQVKVLGSRLHAFVEGADADAAAGLVKDTLAGIQVQELYTAEPDLEDIFIALLQKEQVLTKAPQPEGMEPSFSVHQRNNGTAIEAVNLTRDFGSFRAVDNVSFQVRAGEIFGLLGANGAGKTTVIKMLTGILTPSQGAGHVAGVDMRRAGQAVKRRIGYVSQAFSLYQDLTVMENIRLYSGIYGLSQTETRRRAGWIINMGNLAGYEGALTGSLPMGLRQRLALGCALVHRPQVLFLDEPTSGVDPVGRRQFWDILFELSRGEGVAILVTTHYMSEAEHCDHLALMHSGKVVADAAPFEMKRGVEEEAGRLIELAADQSASAMTALKRAGFGDAALFGKNIHLLSRDPEKDLRRIPEHLADAGILVSSIGLRPLSMEDVFVYRVTSLEKEESKRESRHEKGTPPPHAGQAM